MRKLKKVSSKNTIRDMKIISSFIFILSSILTCSQIQNTFIKDTTRASNGSFLTDSIITNKVLFKDINVENVYKAIRREDCPVRFAARVCCEIKKSVHNWHYL